jgi:transposase-like protein
VLPLRGLQILLKFSNFAKGSLDRQDRTMSQPKTAEFWQAVRALVEGGSSINAAAKHFGIARSNLRERASLEGWKLSTAGLGRPRTFDYRNGAQRAEVEKLLAEHSLEARKKLSRILLRTIDQVEADDLGAKERAQALAALKSVAERLYNWEREALRLEGSGAINLALINTTPQELRVLGERVREIG